MDRLFSQLEAYLQIQKLLDLRAPLNPTRGWAASPDFLIEVLKEILASQKKEPVIVELGSGVSTVVLGYLLERYFPGGKLISLEHDYDFYLETSKQLRLHRLKPVSLLFSPFKYYGLNGKSFRFYQLEALERELGGKKVDFLIVDGPPQTTQKLARYPALPLLKPYLSADFTLFLDDADRPDERQTSLMWKRELEIYSSREVPAEKGLLILKGFSGRKPFFSVCILTYNRKEYLKEALESLARQTYSNFEVLVYDDGSTDGTREAVEEFKDKLQDLRYHRSNENRGRPYGRNFCVSKARGEWIVWLDDDDRFNPELLSRYAEAVNSYPEVEVFYPKEFTVQEGSELHLWSFRDFYRSDREILRYTVETSPLPNPGSCIKREVFERFGGYNPEFLRAQDYELWSRIFPQVERKAVNYNGLVYRLHDSNVSGAGNFGLVDTSYESVVKRRLLNRWGALELFYEFTGLREAIGCFSRKLKEVADYFNASYYLWSFGSREEAEALLKEAGIVAKRGKVKTFFSLLKRPEEALKFGKKLGHSYYLVALSLLLRERGEGEQWWKTALIKAFVVNPLLELPFEFEGFAPSIDRILRKEGRLEDRKEEFLCWIKEKMR